MNWPTVTDAQLDAACAAQYTGADPSSVPADLRRIIEAAITNDPRSLQTRIGPSGLGCPCDRCLAHMLAETTVPPDAAWLPTIGRAVHEWLEMTFIQHETARGKLGMPGRFLTEHKVTVGAVAGQQITGSTDLFDTHTGTVVDWKAVGTTTLRKAKGHGASTTYRRQAMLYGKGWEDAGYTVRSVLIYYLPRNSVSLSDAYPWQAPYDRAEAEQTLLRADRLAMRIHSEGLDPVLASLEPHTGEEFSCKRFPDFTPPSVNSRDPFAA